MQKLILVVLFALLAASCGGSDGADSDEAATTDQTEAVTETDGEAEDQESDEGSDTGDADDPLSQQSELPPPPQIDQAQTRECAHTAAELASDDPSAEAEVELPPDEKPAIEDDYLGSFDDLETIDLIEGTGDTAVAGATVTMQYVGVLGADGTEFDASWNSGNPFTFQLGSGQVIAGWDQGIEGMQVGGRRVLQIPSDLAYGDVDRSEIITAGSDLVFVVDLIGVAGAAPPVDDEYLGAFPSLQVQDIVEGTGCEAQIGDIVNVHYVGVDATTGEQFDSSWSRGETFSVIVGRSQVIDGWNEGLVGMKVGGERILQIPAALAYDQSDLVFRVHLEELIEAPLAHTLDFEGDAPSEVDVEVLVEGSGDIVESGDVIDANIVVTLWDTATILQSTWQQGVSSQLALEGGALLPGLQESIVGMPVGETRRIALPTSIAYPDGIPAQSGIAEGDALVFVIEVVGIAG